MEERKDRERARGALDELQKKKGGQTLVLQGEVAALQKYLDDLRKEYNQAKTKNARDEAKLKNEIDASRIVMEKLESELAKLRSERDDLKQQKEKEFERLKLRVIMSHVAITDCILINTVIISFS